MSVATRKPASRTARDKPEDESLELEEIQGNSIAGFNKDFQTLLVLRIDEPELFKPWLGRFASLVATAEEVLAFNSLFKQTISRRRYQGSVRAAWINIAFSHAGVAKLRKDADRFDDSLFQSGADSQPDWLVRDGDGDADVLIIVAADTLADLALEVAQVEQRIYGSEPRCGASVVFKQEGRAQLGALAGHEHFGFKDGISQPGVRGLLAKGKPGQALVQPGEFVFGYPGEGSDSPVLRGQAPGWAKNGSYLVFRRLKQDVFAFHSFLRAEAILLNLSPDALGAKLVGRWASGAPIELAPLADDPALAGDDLENNHFDFRNDADGDLCPLSSHIRKANPRADVADATELRSHRLLRRGIPYGPTSSSTPSVPVHDDVDRGLLFMAYMTSITDQFDFVARNWLGDPDFSEPGVGVDPLTGDPPGADGTLRREFSVRLGGRDYRLTATRDWVTSTGGGNFFSPSISALRGDLGMQAV